MPGQCRWQPPPGSARSTRRGTATARRRHARPTARRRPISRVRSVTDTSMMFMMPMPPTMQRHGGDAGKQIRHRGGRRRQDARHLLERPHQEVVIRARRSWWRVRSRRRSVGGIVSSRAVLGRHGDVLDVLHAHQLLLHGRVRDDDRVVLVLPHRGLPLAREHANHLERLVLDADDLARRIGADAKQLIAHDGPSTATFAALRHVASVKKLPNCVGHERMAASRHRFPAPACSSCRRGAPICVRVLSTRRDVADARHLLPDRLRIVCGERGDGALPLPDRPEAARAGA